MDTMVTARVPAEVKKRATRAFDELGITATQAINELFEYVAAHQKMPDLRSEEQIMFDGKPRVLDKDNMTPRMREIIEAMKVIESQPPIDWGEDAGKSVMQLLEEAKEERSARLLGY